MLFPTIDFAVFFAVVFLLSWLFTPFPRRWKLFMILASYVFYAWWDWHFVFLLAASTAVAQLGALAIRPTGSPSLRKAALWATVAVELGLLGWFKYYGFFATNVANVLHGMGIGAPLPLLQVTLPVGISFFTFMALSYVIDVYRRELEPASWLDGGWRWPTSATSGIKRSPEPSRPARTAREHGWAAWPPRLSGSSW